MNELIVYFDGLCYLCSTEIEHYKKINHQNLLRFKDICGADFDASWEGLDPNAVHKAIHVKDSAGRILTGVEAFQEIWLRLPKPYPYLSQAVGLSFVKPFAKIGYHCFASIRPYLPKRKPSINGTDCSKSPYCETKK